MLKNATILFVLLCVAGGVYEFTLRDTGALTDKKVLRIGAAGWMISEFLLLDQVKRFQADHPDIEIRMEQLPAGYDTILMIQSDMGELTYDLLLSPSNYDVPKYHKRGHIIPLDDLVPADLKARMIRSMLRISTVGGRLHLLPFMGEVEVLNYRTDLFAKAGLKHPPTTWAQFERYAEKLTRPDEDEYGMSLCLAQNFFFLQNTYLVLLQSVRGGSTVDDEGHLDLTSPAAHKVFRMLKRWWTKGLISPSCKTPGGAASDFKNGLTAMFPNWQSRGLWAMKNERLTEHIALAPLPEAHHVGSLIGIHGAMILKGSKAQAEAGLFLREVMLGYAQKQIIKAGKMPVTTDGYTPGDVPDWMVEVGKTLDKGYAAPELMLITEMAEYVAVAFHKFLDSDSNDPAPFLAEARKEVQRRVYDRQR